MDTRVSLLSPTAATVPAAAVQPRTAAELQPAPAEHTASRQIQQQQQQPRVQVKENNNNKKKNFPDFFHG